jgi:hypothetical protein
VKLDSALLLTATHDGFPVLLHPRRHRRRS